MRRGTGYSRWVRTDAGYRLREPWDPRTNRITAPGPKAPPGCSYFIEGSKVGEQRFCSAPSVVATREAPGKALLGHRCEVHRAEAEESAARWGWELVELEGEGEHEQSPA